MYFKEGLPDNEYTTDTKLISQTPHYQTLEHPSTRQQCLLNVYNTFTKQLLFLLVWWWMLAMIPC